MTESQEKRAKSARSKGPRPKHVPVRTCVVCRDHTSKRALTRIVRTPDGVVTVDPTGRANGRGTYVCDKPSCRTAAATTDVIGRALKVAVPDEVRDALRLPDSSAATPGDAGHIQGEVN